MAKNANTVDAGSLVQGEGALTWTEAENLGSQYRTADRAENLARLRKARIAYVIDKRNVMDSNGSMLDLAKVARAWEVTRAGLQHGSEAYAYVVRLGLAGESDAVQRVALVASDRLRKMGKSDAVLVKIEAGVADILALPVSERADALDAATTPGKKGEPDGAIVSGVKEAKGAERGPARETSDEKAGTSVADVLSTLDALVAVVSEYGQTWPDDKRAEVAARVAVLDAHVAGASALVEEFAAA